jgi:hypothetical protein
MNAPTRSSDWLSANQQALSRALAGRRVGAV